MRALLALLLVGAAAPAFAQHSGHSQPPASPPTSCTPEHAAMGHCTRPPAAPATDPHAGHDMPAQQRPSQPVADPHAGHPMPEPEQPVADPHAGHQMPAQDAQPSPDPHAGHQMPAPEQKPSADPHAGHDTAAAASEVPIGPPPAGAFEGPENAADIAWGIGAMEPGRAVLFQEHGDIAVAKVLIDQLETRVRSGRDGYYLNAQGWYGGDINKLWLKTEVEGSYGSNPEQAEFQALWSHAINPWFDFQTGVRFDAEPDTRGHLVAGVQGLAPYWIEVEAAAFVSDKGDFTARLEAEHDVRITRKLILQPRTELNFSLQDIPRRGVGSGLSNAELGLRLRYEIVPNFAPYVGVHYERAFGGTRRYLKAEGEGPDSWHFVAGLRAWF